MCTQCFFILMSESLKNKQAFLDLKESTSYACIECQCKRHRKAAMYSTYNLKKYQSWCHLISKKKWELLQRKNT